MVRNVHLERDNLGVGSPVSLRTNQQFSLKTFYSISRLNKIYCRLTDPLFYFRVNRETKTEAENHRTL